MSKNTENGKTFLLKNSLVDRTFQKLESLRLQDSVVSRTLRNLKSLRYSNCFFKDTLRGLVSDGRSIVRHTLGKLDSLRMRLTKLEAEQRQFKSHEKPDTAIRWLDDTFALAQALVKVPVRIDLNRIPVPLFVLLLIATSVLPATVVEATQKVVSNNNFSLRESEATAAALDYFLDDRWLNRKTNRSKPASSAKASQPGSADTGRQATGIAMAPSAVTGSAPANDSGSGSGAGPVSTAPPPSASSGVLRSGQVVAAPMSYQGSSQEADEAMFSEMQTLRSQGKLAQAYSLALTQLSRNPRFTRLRVEAIGMALALRDYAGAHRLADEGTSGAANDAERFIYASLMKGVPECDGGTPPSAGNTSN